jgi:single-stranded-DNA-specific exonuclease
MELDPGPAGEAALALARALGTSFTFADVVTRRGAESGDRLARWLDPKLSHLTPPSDMADLGAAAERIARAVRNRERICVFGDYDCDGITASAILTEVLGVLGADVTCVLASRFAGGYGLSAAALDRVRATGASLLVTCDCGSADHERLETARKHGIDAVVIDHHLVPDEALPAVAFLNPHRPECGFPYKGLASCGLALIVATALRRALAVDLDVRRWLDLVAIGTIADVAPLDGDNRVLVRAGLRAISRGGRVGLRALATRGSGGRLLPMTAEGVAYQIAPRINAPGRLGDPKLSFAVLLARDAAEAFALAERVERATLERRSLQRRMTAEAMAEIAERGFAEQPAIVLARPDWHVGVVGIVAGRIADTFGKPTVIIALEGSARGRGSARAPSGFRLYDALAKSRDALLGFGGHQAAAGVEVAPADVERFRDAFNQACADQLAGMPGAAPRHLPDVRLDPRDDLAQVLTDLERLEPCGEANPPPRLLIENVSIVDAREIKEHLKLDLELRGQRLSAFAPDMGPRLDSLPPTATLVGRLKRDHYRGGALPEILVEAIL